MGKKELVKYTSQLISDKQSNINLPVYQFTRGDRMNQIKTLNQSSSNAYRHFASRGMNAQTDTLKRESEKIHCIII